MLTCVAVHIHQHDPRRQRNAYLCCDPHPSRSSDAAQCLPVLRSTSITILGCNAMLTCVAVHIHHDPRRQRNVSSFHNVSEDYR